jgi:hypothetical protein
MSIIPCTNELCAKDQHEATAPEQVRHERVTSDEGAEHHVVAYWAGDKGEGGHIVFTFDGDVIDITARDGAFWANVLTAGGSFTPAVGTGTGRIAVDLGLAAEILYWVDPDSEPLGFISRHLSNSVERAMDTYFRDESEEVDA